MCGRYLITTAPEAMRRLFRYRDMPNFPPRYNVAPTQPVPLVRLDQNGERRFALVRWGLLPPWVKDPKGFSLLINARAETIHEKPAFKNAMKRRRCLLPADGFYEWATIGGRKRPFVLRSASGEPLAFAGLWETWIGPNGEELETAAIVTTQANAEMGRVHHRAPVIIPPAAFDLWLDGRPDDVMEASALMGAAPDGTMQVYEISTAVNKVTNDAPELLLPYTAPDELEAPPAKPARARTKPPSSDDGQGSLF